MKTQEMAAPPTRKDSELRSKLLKQYGYGPIQFSGTDNAFYERHLVFDNAVELGTILPADGGDCEEVLAQFAKAGIDVDTLAAQLQDEGAKSFVKSWNDLMAVIASKSATLAKAG